MSPRAFEDDLLDDEPSGPSKTQVKKAMHELQALGQTLMSLPVSVLDTLELEAELRDAMDAHRRMKSHEAKRRQAQFIGKLMRSLDTGPIRQALERHRLGASAMPAASASSTSDAQRWCDRLLDEPASMTDWVRHHPDSDAQHLRRLLRAARAAAVTAQDAPDETREAAEAARRRAVNALQGFIASALGR